MDVDDGARSKRGQSDEAGGDSHGLMLMKRKEDEGGRMRAKPVYENALNVLRQVTTVAHRILCIGASHPQHRSAMLRVVEIRSDDSKCVHGLPSAVVSRDAAHA